MKSKLSDWVNIRLILVAIALVFQILSFMKLSGHDYIGIPFVPGPTEQVPTTLDASSPLQLGAIEASEMSTIPAPAGSFVAAEQQGSGPKPISIVAGASPMGGQAGGGAASPQSPQAAAPGSPDRPTSGAPSTGSSGGGSGNNFGGVVGSPIGNHGGSGGGDGTGGGGESPSETPGGGDDPTEGPSGGGSGGSGGGGGGPQGGPGGSGGIPAGNGGGGGNPIGEPAAGGGGSCLVVRACESAGGGPGSEESAGDGGGDDPDRGEESGDGGSIPAKPTDSDEDPTSPFEPAPTGPATS